MNTKIFNNSRFTPKGDSEANWNKAVGFIPLDKEIIIYKSDAKHSVARLKVGDGITTVQDLPFITDIEGVASEEWVKAYGAELSELLKQYTDEAVAASESGLKQYTDDAIAAIDFPEFNQDYDRATENLILDKNMQNIPLGKIVAYDAMLKMIIIEGVHNICQNGDIILIGESHIEAKINSIYIDNSRKYTYFYLDRDIDPNLVGVYVYLNNVFSISAINSFEIKDSQARQDYRNLKNNYDALNVVFNRLNEKNNEQDDKIAKIEDKVIIATFNITEANTAISVRCVANTTKVDWGDGNSTNEFDEYFNTSHIYTNPGVYTCKIYNSNAISWSAFVEATMLTDILIPSTIASIGSYAFQGCNSLTSIGIPDSVKEISDYAFSNCNGLMSVVIPDGVTYLGGGVFGGCSSLTSIELRSKNPSSYFNLSNIFNGMMGTYNCPALTYIYVPYGCKQLYIDKFRLDGAIQDILDKIVESDREANMSDVNALKSEIQEQLVGKTDYLGTVAAMSDLSTIAGAGDYHRVSAEFVYDESTGEVAHVGDILIAIIDTPGQNKECWDLIHTDLGVTPATAEDINSIFEEA